MSTSKSKAAYHHGDLREALIAAALAILEEGGDPAALTLREAARRAGVSAMAPYRHFADKDSLLAAVASVGFARLRDALGQADVATDPQEAILGQGVAYVRFAIANPSLFRLMFGAAVAAFQGGERLATGESAFRVMAQRVGSIVGPERSSDWEMLCWASAHGIASLAIDGRLGHSGDETVVLADRVLRLLAISGPRPEPSKT